MLSYLLKAATWQAKDGTRNKKSLVGLLTAGDANQYCPCSVVQMTLNSSDPRL